MREIHLKCSQVKILKNKMARSENTAWLTIWYEVKIPRCSHKVMHRKRVTCELHVSYFRSTMIKPVASKRAEVAYSVDQLWEEIVWAKRRVHISAWEFDGNIRSTILNGRQ